MRVLIDYYARLSAERANEGPGVQLACLVLADWCTYVWSDDRGGPTSEQLALAERVLNETMVDRIAIMKRKMTAS
jgi:hypothetical protein